MEWDFQQMFSPPPIMGVTINTVFLSPEVLLIMYGTMASLLVAGTIFFSMQKNRFVAALKKAAVVAFFGAGLLYAVHADIGWSIWLSDDAWTFSGLDTNAKLTRLEGGIADFSRAAGNILGPEYMIFTSDEYVGWRTEYLLLPHRRRDRADDIVVLADNLSRYDPVARAFTRNDLKVENVEPVLIFAKNAYILRKRK